MDKEYEPNIIAFLCNWCSYAGADLAGVSRFQYPANPKVVRVPCSGRINPMFIVKSLYEGLDGVWVSGCHPGDCHYNTGNYYARRRFALLKNMLSHIGFEEDRTLFSWVSASEGNIFADKAKEVTARIKKLGPRKKLLKNRDI